MISHLVWLVLRAIGDARAQAAGVAGVLEKTSLEGLAVLQVLEPVLRLLLLMAV